MRVVVRVVSVVLMATAIGAASASWFTPRPKLDAADAADVAVEALASVGVEAEVVGTPTLGVHEYGLDDATPSQDEDEAPEVVDAWFVDLRVDTDDGPDTIEVRVQEAAGQLVYVDDAVGPDDTVELLTDEQVDELADYLDDSLTDRWVIENGAASVAAVVVSATGFVLARRSDKLWRRR